MCIRNERKDNLQRQCRSQPTNYQQTTRKKKGRSKHAQISLALRTITTKAVHGNLGFQKNLHLLPSKIRLAMIEFALE
jgi:hypothetical protein